VGRGRVDDKRGVTMGGISYISFPDKLETDRFQITFGTEPVRFRYFWFGSCKYRNTEQGTSAYNI
jgi:hypothetical protein